MVSYVFSVAGLEKPAEIELLITDAAIIEP